MIVVTPDLSRPCGSDLRVTIRSGRNFRVESPPVNALVTPALADELQRALNQFGRDVTNDCGKRELEFSSNRASSVTTKSVVRPTSMGLVVSDWIFGNGVGTKPGNALLARIVHLKGER